MFYLNINYKPFILKGPLSLVQGYYDTLTLGDGEKLLPNLFSCTYCSIAPGGGGGSENSKSLA